MVIRKSAAAKPTAAKKVVPRAAASPPVSGSLSYASAALGGRRRTVSEGTALLSAVVEVCMDCDALNIAMNVNI